MDPLSYLKIDHTSSPFSKFPSFSPCFSLLIKTIMRHRVIHKCAYSEVGRKNLNSSYSRRVIMVFKKMFANVTIRSTERGFKQSKKMTMRLGCSRWTGLRCRINWRQPDLFTGTDHYFNFVRSGKKLMTTQMRFMIIPATLVYIQNDRGKLCCKEDSTKWTENSIAQTLIHSRMSPYCSNKPEWSVDAFWKL